MNDLIEKLKKNEKPFGLLTPEEQECFRKVGKKNCLIYDGEIEGWTTNYITDSIFSSTRTYAIKPDYKPEPEFVDLEIVSCPCSNHGKSVPWLGVLSTTFGALPHDFTHLHCLPSLPNFDDFWYQDSPGCNVFGIKETAIARCIFEGKKPFARFRR